jgi:predicted PurR-regulated permease PerM
VNTRESALLRVTNYFLGIIVFALVIFILMQLKSIFIPITFAVLLTFLLHPAYAYLIAKKIPAGIVLAMLLAGLFLILYLIIVLLVSSAAEINKNSAFYVQKINELAASLLRPFNLTMAGFLSALHLDQSMDIGAVLNGLFATGIIQSIVSSFSTSLTYLFIILLTWSFMIAGKSAFDVKLRTVFHDGDDSITDKFLLVDKQIQIYIVVKTLVGLTMSAVVTIILLIMGVDFAVLWGILTFLLHFIPNIGSLIATIFPITFALVQFGFSGRLVAIVILLISNQFVFGNIVEAKYLGKHLNLSPVVVLLALFFWGWVWGIPGMFLSVPLVAMMKIIFEHIPALKPIAVLMGGKLS